MMIRIGDKKRFTPEGFSVQKKDAGPSRREEMPKEVTGTVVWIHPTRRYYTVEYQCHGVRLKESFPMKGCV